MRKDLLLFKKNDHHGCGGALVRPTGQCIINVRTRILTSGLTRVSAHTMGGDLVCQVDYGRKDECRVYEFRHEVRKALINQSKANYQTKIVLLHSNCGDCELRGNVLLKRAVKDPVDKFRFRNDHVSQPTMSQFLKKQKDKSSSSGILQCFSRMHVNIVHAVTTAMNF